MKVEESARSRCSILREHLPSTATQEEIEAVVDHSTQSRVHSILVQLNRARRHQRDVFFASIGQGTSTGCIPTNLGRLVMGRPDRGPDAAAIVKLLAAIRGAV